MEVIGSIIAGIIVLVVGVIAKSFKEPIKRWWNGRGEPKLTITDDQGNVLVRGPPQRTVVRKNAPDVLRHPATGRLPWYLGD